MEKETIGLIISTKKLWWIKINKKAFRMNSLDGAIFPSVVKVKYSVNGVDYIKRKFISPYTQCPMQGGKVTVRYREDKPLKCRIEI